MTIIEELFDVSLSRNRFSSLDQLFVLVAEDEPYIALNLAFAVEDAGGRVVGPVASVEEALALLETNPVSAAILDVNLADGDISPVVEILVELGVPIILQTGIGLPPELAARFPGLVVHLKPCHPDKLIEELVAMLEPRRA